MKRKSDDPLEKVTLNLIKGDYSKLQVIFHRTGAAAAIRKIVHSFLQQHDAKIKSLRTEVEGILEDSDGN